MVEIGKKYTCIAIDDDSLFLRLLRSFIREIEWLDLMDTYDSPVKGATAIVTHKPDLVFLDMDMPYVDGQYLLDWIGPKLEKMHPSPRVIVISSMINPPEKVLSKVAGFINKHDIKDPQALSSAIISFL